MELAIKNYGKYCEMGAKAFREGKKCVPARNSNFVNGFDDDEWKGKPFNVDNIKYIGYANQSAEAWIGG